MRFFFDRNISKYLARAISELNRHKEIVAHDDDQRFKNNTTDLEWI